MKVKKILFVIYEYNKSAPRTIRIKKIISEIKTKYRIEILSLGNFDKSVDVQSSIKIHKIHFSKIGRKYFFRDSTILNDNYTTIKSKHRKHLIKNYLKKVFFPDKYIIEIFRYRYYLKKLLLKNDYDIVIGVSFPFSVMLLGALVKKINHKIRWVVDLGDPMLNNSANPQNKFLKFVTKEYEKYVLKFTDSLIVTNQQTKGHYIKYYRKQITEQNIFVIPQGADILNSSNKQSRGYIKNEKLKLIYAGKFYEKLRDPKYLFTAIDSFQKDLIELNIYGPISDKFISTKFNNELSNIKYMGSIEHKYLINKYQENDIVVFIDNAFGFQLSGKIFELIATKKPILFIYNNEESPCFDIVNEYGGIVPVKNNYIEIKKALQKLLSNSNKFNFDFNLKYYTWKYREDQYTRLLEKY